MLSTAIKKELAQYLHNLLAKITIDKIKKNIL